MQANIPGGALLRDRTTGRSKGGRNHGQLRTQPVPDPRLNHGCNTAATKRLPAGANGNVPWGKSPVPVRQVGAECSGGPPGVRVGPVRVDLSTRSGGRRAKIRQGSKTGAAAPRDTVALGGSDEDTPWEGPLPMGLSERRWTAIASNTVSGTCTVGIEPLALRSASA